MRRDKLQQCASVRDLGINMPGIFMKSLSAIITIANHTRQVVKMDISSIKSNTGILKDDIGATNSEISTMKTEMDIIKSEISAMNSVVGTIDIGNQFDEI